MLYNNRFRLLFFFLSVALLCGISVTPLYAAPSKQEIDQYARANGFPKSDYPYFEPPNGCGGEGATGKLVRDTWGDVSFVSACDTHDRCYSTPDSGFSDCNYQFYLDLLKACDDGIPRYRLDELVECGTIASTYYSGVQTAGWFWYTDAQKEAAKYKKVVDEFIRASETTVVEIDQEPYIVQAPTPPKPLICPTGICVTKLAVSAEPRRKKPIYFTMTLVNSTGGPQTHNLIALLFYADSKKGFGESLKNRISVPPGTSQTTVEYTGVTGGGPCIKFYAQAASHHSESDKPTFPNIDGQPLTVPFEVCP